MVYTLYNIDELDTPIMRRLHGYILGAGEVIDLEYKKTRWKFDFKEGIDILINIIKKFDTKKELKVVDDTNKVLYSDGQITENYKRKLKEKKKLFDLTKLDSFLKENVIIDYINSKNKIIVGLKDNLIKDMMERYKFKEDGDSIHFFNNNGTHFATLFDKGTRYQMLKHNGTVNEYGWLKENKKPNNMKTKKITTTQLRQFILKEAAKSAKKNIKEADEKPEDNLAELFEKMRTAEVELKKITAKINKANQDFLKKFKAEKDSTKKEELKKSHIVNIKKLKSDSNAIDIVAKLKNDVSAIQTQIKKFGTVEDIDIFT